MDGPSTFTCEFGQHLAVHDGVGAALVWNAALDGDVIGEIGRPRPKRIETIGSGRRCLQARPVSPTPSATDVRTSATNAARRRHREVRPSVKGVCATTWWIGAAGIPGSINSISDGPRPCGPPRPSRPRPSRSDGRCRDACPRFCPSPTRTMPGAPGGGTEVPGAVRQIGSSIREPLRRGNHGGGRRSHSSHPDIDADEPGLNERPVLRDPVRNEHAQR